MSNRTSHSYYVVMIDYGTQPRSGLGPYGLEAIANPEITRREVVARIKSHEYQNIAFIHHVDGLFVEDVTSELIDAAELELKEEHAANANHLRILAELDHLIDLHKHEVA